MAGPLHCPCQGAWLAPLFVYTAPPAGETRFAPPSAPYRRTVWRCRLCGHCVSQHAMDPAALYAGAYVEATYGDEGLRRAFARIVSLPPARSDNAGRVRRLLAFAAAHFGPAAPPPTLLDVGSGLGVFVHAMRAAGWRCTALDPDPRAVRHARDVVGVAAVCGDFLQVRDLGRFDVVTFNKVLEHVADPVAMLAKSACHLQPGGFVYVEVPDADAARREGPEREEFFIEHLHVFSAASLALLAQRAGFWVRQLARLHEPSGKYTLYAFLTPEAEQETAHAGCCQSPVEPVGPRQ
ncbi:MAG: hypothetical protein KatS3mg131_1321 [Candidatus Tectimicrobiota bacterium]|nr:MAG: hypothetical protein KatS3mg131_1321 [Candidatus Tectomicrobia bacterium]